MVRCIHKRSLEKEVAKYNKNFIQEKRAFGELGHPDGPTVNLERVSHDNKSVEDGKNFIGEAKIMSTPMGEIVKNLMDEGVKLGVSSRGMGSLEQKNGANHVRDDFYLATSWPISLLIHPVLMFVEGIMEGKEWVWNNGALLEAELVEMKREFDAKQVRLDETRKVSYCKVLKRL